MDKYTGKQHMQINIANHMGLDKKSFDDRINWVIEHESILEAYVAIADDFFQYAAAVKAYRKAQAGEPSGYLVGLDACASGIQWLSVLTGCKTGAANSGVTGQVRQDPYKIATDIMNGLLNQTKEYDRATVKTALMT